MKNNLEILCLLTTFNLLFFSACDSNPLDNKPFNQQLWFANPVSLENNHNIRLYMSEDILKNHLKIGMTKQDTRKLLGQPDRVIESCCEDYLLGEYWLKLTFDNKGKLISKEIVSI